MAAFTRINDGTEFGLDDGLELLAPFVYNTLRGVAKVFGATITYKELGDEVLQSSGLATNMGLQNWIGRLLAKVVRMAHEENAPPLTALVVRSDSGMVGEGYDEVLTVAGESSIENEVDREDHAASARFSCYQHFGAVIPGGAKPMLARNYVEHLSRKRKSADVPVVEVCKTCFLELPASGDCSNCA